MEKMGGGGAGSAAFASAGAVSGGGVVCAFALAIETLSAIAARAGTTRAKSDMTEFL
jgi:hypothetical protein